MGNPKVNDGKGLWDNEGICDKAILICNEALKQLISGEYLNFCSDMFQIAKILQNLKEGIKRDRESLEQKIEDLKSINDSLSEQLNRPPVLKDGVESE